MIFAVFVSFYFTCFSLSIPFVCGSMEREREREFERARAYVFA
jgi:hypothetical protein